MVINMKRRAIAIILCLAFLPLGGAAARAAGDAPSPWAAGSVSAAIEAKLVPQALQGGYAEATTRAEFCALAVTLYEIVMGREIAGRRTFGDTDDVYVEKAAAVGVVFGLGDDTFAPGDKLNREQAAAMLARLADMLLDPLEERAPSFADNGGIASWAIKEVGQVQAAGIMDGVGNNMFAPKRPYTREQSIVTVYRTYQYLMRSGASMAEALTAVAGIPTAPWQDAYIELLWRICGEEAPVRNMPDSEEYDSLSDSYGLYDIDEDGVPELFIKFGAYEANYRAEVFTYGNGAVTSLGILGFGHSGLYSYPGQKAAILEWGHMGYQEISKIVIVDGRVELQGALLSVDTNETGDSYAPVSDVVPGAEYVDFHRTALPFPSGAPRTLPIYDYVNGPHPTGSSSESAREAITEVLGGKRELFGVSGDGYGGDTGWMSFGEYCQPGCVSKYSQAPMATRSFVWLDMNRDGQDEYVVSLVEEGTASNNQQVIVIMSYQGGIVFAYSLNYVPVYYVLGRDGAFFADEDGEPTLYTVRYSFYKNQCYEIHARASGGTNEVAWKPF